jgi:hypothetical protein
MNVILEVKINEADFRNAAREEELRIERRLNSGVDRILDTIEAAQIGSYQAGSNPARPPGSTYIRTFDLQRASKKQRTRRILPEISGVWSVDEGKVRYGDYVLGTRAQQARIHRGRWKSKTEVEKEAKEKAPQIIEEELRKN